MKKFLTILVLGLVWCNTSIADEISDFQIEGMSIGDSLLDYYSENEIKNGFPTDWSYKKKTYQATDFSKNLKDFDNVQINFKTKGKNYTIGAIDGMSTMDIKDCLKEKDEQILAMQELLSEAKNTYDGTTKHSYDKSGDSKIIQAVYKLKSGGVIIVSCYDWSDKLTSSKGWDDSLRISIRSKKFNKFLANAY